jgi:hypothetical protein
MTIKINTALDHIEKSLIANRSERFTLPSLVLDTIQPTIDAKGWQRIPSYEREATTTPGPTSNVLSAQVPDDEMWYVFAANVIHTDTTGPLNITMKIDLEPGEIALVDTVSVASGMRVTLPRPVVLPPRGRLTGNSLTPGIAVLFDFIIQMYFIRLKVGEYIVASPYG